MRIQLKHHRIKSEKKVGTKEQKLAEELKNLASKKAKLTGQIRDLNRNVVDMQKVQQAGLLAHYALLTMILGSITEGFHRKQIEKELENLGLKEQTLQEKLGHLKIFDKTSKEISDLSKEMEKLDDSKKELFLPKIQELEKARDEIAKMLGLSPEEYSALTQVFDEYNKNGSKIAIIGDKSKEKESVSPLKEAFKMVESKTVYSQFPTV